MSNRKALWVIGAILLVFGILYSLPLAGVGVLVLLFVGLTTDWSGASARVAARQDEREAERQSRRDDRSV